MTVFYKIWIACLVLTISACAVQPQAQSERRAQAEMHYKLAVAHLQNSNPTYALKELLDAVKLDPENSEIHVALAQAYQKKGAYAKAESHYLKALELSPDNPRYQNNFGALYLDMKQWDKAIEYFDQAASNLLFLNVHIAVAGKGYAYFQKGDYGKALAAYKEAERLAPRYALVYFYESQVYQAQGQDDLEKAALVKAVDLAPQFLEARYRLAVLLTRENDLRAAREQLKAIVSRAPISDWGVKAKDMLKVLNGS